MFLNPALISRNEYNSTIRTWLSLHIFSHLLLSLLLRCPHNYLANDGVGRLTSVCEAEAPPLSEERRKTRGREEKGRRSWRCNGPDNKGPLLVFSFPTTTTTMTGEEDDMQSDLHLHSTHSGASREGGRRDVIYGERRQRRERRRPGGGGGARGGRDGEETPTRSAGGQSPHNKQNLPLLSFSPPTLSLALWRRGGGRRRDKKRG